MSDAVHFVLEMTLKRVTPAKPATKNRNNYQETDATERTVEDLTRLVLSNVDPEVLLDQAESHLKLIPREY